MMIPGRAFLTPARQEPVVADDLALPVVEVDPLAEVRDAVVAVADRVPVPEDLVEPPVVGLRLLHHSVRTPSTISVLGRTSIFTRIRVPSSVPARTAACAAVG